MRILAINSYTYQNKLRNSSTILRKESQVDSSKINSPKNMAFKGRCAWVFGGLGAALASTFAAPIAAVAGVAYLAAKVGECIDDGAKEYEDSGFENGVRGENDPDNYSGR